MEQDRTVKGREADGDMDRAPSRRNVCAPNAAQLCRIHRVSRVILSIVRNAENE